MSEDALMTGLSVVVFIGIVAFVLTQILKQKSPHTALFPFKSFKEIKSYFSTAISVLSAKRWLLVLPLCLSLSDSIIRTLIVLYRQPEISTHSAPEMSNLADFFWAKISFASILRSLLRTPQILDYGYSGAIVGIPFIGFFIVCAITYKAEARKMRHYASEDNIASAAFFENILRLALVLLIIIAGLATIVLLSGKVSGILRFVLWGPGTMLLGLLSLSLLSLIEGFILYSVKGVLEAERLDFREILNRSLRILRPLFFLNLLLSIIGMAPSVCLLPMTLEASLSPDGSSSFGQEILWPMADFFGYLHSAVAACTVCAPFIMVVYQMSVLDTLRKNFRFIRDHFLKYLLFIGGGIVILFVPSALHQVLTALCSHPLSFCSVLIDVLLEILRVGLSVVFYIAAFTFFITTDHALSENKGLHHT